MGQKNIYLFEICYTCVSLVMTFLIQTIAETFRHLYADHVGITSDPRAISIFCISLTCLVAILGVIMTMGVAHKKIEFQFTPVYFFISMFLVAIPLYFSVSLLSTSLHPMPNNSFQIDLKSLNLGMSLFILAFVGLLIYLLWIFFTEDSTLKAKIGSRLFLGVGAFHGAAIIFAFLIRASAGDDFWLMLLSVAALVGSFAFLVFLADRTNSLSD